MKDPDIAGPAGRAWRFRPTDSEREIKPHGLDAYVVHQPGVHAVWSWWWITGCDLYDDDGGYGRLPAKKHRADVTHEFLCFALNPESGYFAGAEPPDGWDSCDETVLSSVGRHYLTPPEFVHQDELRDNDQANEVLRLFVKAVCDGYTAADADFRSRNLRLLAGTAEHFRQGRHEVY